MTISHPHFSYVYLLVSSRDSWHWSHILWTAVEKKLGDICVAARSWEQERKRTASREHLQGEVGRAEHAKTDHAYLKIFLEFALCSEMEKNLSSSLPSPHFQSYYWLHGPMPTKILKLSCTLIVIQQPFLRVH